VHASTITAGGAVNLTVSDAATLIVVAGGFAGASSAAFGAAVAVNNIGDRLLAYIDPSTVGATSVSLSVTGNADITAIAVGGAGADSFALGGSVATNNIGNTLDGHISDGSLVIVPRSVVISVNEGGSIFCVAGGVSGAGAAAVGAALST